MTILDLTFEAAFGVNPGRVPGKLVLDGTSGTFASCPDAAALDITGDIDVRMGMARDWQSQSGTRILASKWMRTGDNRSWRFDARVNGRLRWRVSNDGLPNVVFAESTEGVPFVDGRFGAVRVTWRASDGRTQFFYADHVAGSWTKLGSDVTHDFTSIFASAADLAVGAEIEGFFSGDGGFQHVQRLEVRSGIGGTLAASPDFTGTGDGWEDGDGSTATAKDDGQGNPWSLEGDATIDGEWADLSGRLGDPAGIRWTYGRQTELDRVDAGAGAVSLDNTDRALDPTNEQSTFWPDVRPMTRVRLRATHDAVTYDILEGFVEEWTPRWQHPQLAWVEVPVVDGFKLLSMARTSISFPQQNSGTRVAALLDAAGWPAGKRDVDTGQSQVQEYTASDRIVLNAIREAAEAESGVFLILPDGNAAFRDRTRRFLAESQATFGDGDVELPYEQMVPSFSDATLWNDVAVKPVGLTVQRAQDADSIAKYGRRWLDFEDTLTTTEDEAQDLADWTLSRYREPRLRVDEIVLSAVEGPVFEQMLLRQVGDRVTVKRRPPGGGDPISLEVFVEQVTHRIAGMEWHTTWRLSPASPESVWLIGVAGFSEIGVTTRVGF